MPVLLLEPVQVAGGSAARPGRRTDRGRASSAPPGGGGATRRAPGTRPSWSAHGDAGADPGGRPRRGPRRWWHLPRSSKPSSPTRLGRPPRVSRTGLFGKVPPVRSRPSRARAERGPRPSGRPARPLRGSRGTPRRTSARRRPRRRPRAGSRGNARPRPGGPRDSPARARGDSGTRRNDPVSAPTSFLCVPSPSTGIRCASRGLSRTISTWSRSPTSLSAWTG